MIRVSREDDDLIRVSSEKTKDSAPFADYYLRPITIDLGYTDSLGEKVTTLVCLPAAMVTEQDDLTNLQRKVLGALAFDPMASISEVCEIVEIRHRGQVQKLIQALKRKGYLKVQGRNRSFTEKGKNALQIPGDSSDSINDEQSATLS
jgi:hypothetical protein